MKTHASTLVILLLPALVASACSGGGVDATGSAPDAAAGAQPDAVTTPPDGAEDATVDAGADVGADADASDAAPDVETGPTESLSITIRGSTTDTRWTAGGRGHFELCPSGATCVYEIPLNTAVVVRSVRPTPGWSPSVSGDLPSCVIDSSTGLDQLTCMLVMDRSRAGTIEWVDCSQSSDAAVCAPPDAGGPPVLPPDTWGPLPVTGLSARAIATSVWTGSELLIWGGESGGFELGDGAAYDPSTGGWRQLATAGAPTPRQLALGAWTGSEMIVWGGWIGGPGLRDGARYDPVADAWTPMSSNSAPSVDPFFTRCLWTGSEMMVWDSFGVAGALYDPSSDTWRAMSTASAPTPRKEPAMIWTGTVAVVWGGNTYNSATPPRTGAQYDPLTNLWTPVSTAGAPSQRWDQAAVWDGREMIVWGGADYDPQVAAQSGAKYDPQTDSWTPISSAGAPPAARGASAVWTGTEMIVWGGGNADLSAVLNTGGRYDPLTDSWALLPALNAPAARILHVTAWTGAELLVWGGTTFNREFGTGARYRP